MTTSHVGVHQNTQWWTDQCLSYNLNIQQILIGLKSAVLNLKPEALTTVLLRTAVSGRCISVFDSRKDTTHEIDYTGWEVREARVCACCLNDACSFTDSLLEWQHSWRRRRRGRPKLTWKPSRFICWKDLFLRVHPTILQNVEWVHVQS